MSARRPIRGITGEMYTAEELSKLSSGFQYTLVCNYSVEQFQIHGHGYTDEQLTAIVLVYRDGVGHGHESGRASMRADIRKLLGIEQESETN